MFEDSTFDSAGRIRARSRGGAIASMALNGLLLLALVAFPLLYPQILPSRMSAYIMDAPQLAPPTQPKPQPRVERAAMVQPEMSNGHIFAPRIIPDSIFVAMRPEALPDLDVTAMDGPEFTPGGADNPFGATHHVVVRRAPETVRLPSSVVAAMLVVKTMPVYPAIAKAAGMQGTVVLQATISRTGTIENLHVLSGPAMLQQAALDAVKTWRYRPYLLNDQPVEVETTVNVIFTLAR